MEGGREENEIGWKRGSEQKEKKELFPSKITGWTRLRPCILLDVDPMHNTYRPTQEEIAVALRSIDPMHCEILLCMFPDKDIGGRIPSVIKISAHVSANNSSVLSGEYFYLITLTITCKRHRITLVRKMFILDSLQMWW